VRARRAAASGSRWTAQRRDRIAEADVDLQCQARAVEGGAQIDAHAAVACVLADGSARDRIGVEHDAVVHRDAADGSEDANERSHVIGAEPQQIGVACRPVRLAVPELEQQRALEQKVRCVLRDRQPVQQTFQPYRVRVRLKSCFDVSVCCFSLARIDAARLAVMP
jgi:hypothetical protein